MHLEDTTPKARKPYRCYCCGESIAIGEVHVKRAYIGDDGPESIRMHPECRDATSDWDDGDWEEFFMGDLRRPVEGIPC